MPDNRLDKIRQVYDSEPTEIELIVKEFVQQLNFYKGFYEHIQEYHGKEMFASCLTCRQKYHIKYK